MALLPDQLSRCMNSGTRLYRADIAITSLAEAMRPGMSCAIEILEEGLARRPIRAATRGLDAPRTRA